MSTHAGYREGCVRAPEHQWMRRYRGAPDGPPWFRRRSQGAEGASRKALIFCGTPERRGQSAQTRPPLMRSDLSELTPARRPKNTARMLTRAAGSNARAGAHQRPSRVSFTRAEAERPYSHDLLVVKLGYKGSRGVTHVTLNGGREASE